jgi:hypothetical protein
MISLAKHIPSHNTVAGKRVLVSYDEQSVQWDWSSIPCVPDAPASEGDSAHGRRRQRIVGGHFGGRDRKNKE